MAFDAKTFLQSGGNPGGMMASFGLPSCMIGLASDVLGLIPSPILLAMRMAMEEAQRLANAAIKRINSYIRDKLGISLFPDRDGFFGFLSGNSRFGLDVISGIGATIGTFMGFASAAMALANELESKFKEAKDCLESYKNFLDFSDGNAGSQPNVDPAGYSDLINSQFGVWFEQTQIAQDFVDSVEAQKNLIDDILLRRTLDPSLEPGQEDLGVVESVFRLDAGPPKSTSGKFVLSVDGLYYDSQTDGITPALLELADREKSLESITGGFANPNLWKLEHDPSLGGRGIPTTSKDLEFYFNSILDPNILDNSKGLTAFYNQDELLLSLEGQKDRKIFDVSEEIQELIDDGESQAVIDNLRQAMLSETSYFQNKIDKRKKQVELAVKVPVWMGRGPLYEHGKIPVNDFSYLAGSNFLVDIKSQREITINQADVEGVVLPLVVKYTEKIETNDPITLNHLLLANIARGETINTALGTSASTLHINDRIIEDQLFALYNYLTIETSVPSGTNFGVYNGGGNGIGYNAQIVGEASSTFTKGLGIPFLSGVAFPEEGNLSAIESMGTYVKAPARNEFKDLLYNTKGATFETWIHMPALDNTIHGWNIHNNNTLGLYRLILANENVGISDSKVPQPDINNLNKDGGTGIVRGTIFGFTRDRRFTLGLDPSNNEVDNSIENLVLVLAPTQSYDSSSAGFIANRLNCGKESYHGMTIPVFSNINGKSLSSCGESFSLLSVSIDPVKDEVRVYLDGSKLATSGYQTTFATSRPGEVCKSPSVKQNNSFEYSGGPYLDAYFTPWMLGGGYTDGNPDGNFMGGEYGGKVSGLKGYLGCTKFYSKPLTDGEVLNNYKASSNFFKNINVTDLWEPIVSE